MKVKLIGKKRIISLILPQRIYGNYWITSEDNENLINIEALNNKWVIKSNADIKIVSEDSFIESTELMANHFYNFLDVLTNEKYRVFVGETFDSKMLLLDILEPGNIDFYIGNSISKEGGNPNYISYENDNIHFNQIRIVRTNGIFLLKNLQPDVNVYVNNYLTNECYLKNGDVVFVEGLTFAFVGSVLMLGTIDNKIKYVTSKFMIHQTNKIDYSMLDSLTDSSIQLYTKDDYFVRPPRFNEIIETKNFNVDGPPNKEETEKMPVILTLGPMLVMGMSSSVAGAIALINVANGTATFKDSYPSILTAACMLTAMLVFPSASKAYQSHREKKKEQLRQQKYREYLAKLDKNIKDECIRQKRILIESNVSLKDVGDVILYIQKKKLMGAKTYS